MMTFTRSYRETIREQLADPEFRREFLREAVSRMAIGDLQTAKLILHEYVNGMTEVSQEPDQRDG